MSITRTAIELEDARQRALYWLAMWANDRRNERFLYRYARAVRACDRLTRELHTP